VARSTEPAAAPPGLPRPQLPPARQQLVRLGRLLLLVVVVTAVSWVVTSRLRGGTLLAVGTAAPALQLTAAEGGSAGLTSGTPAVVEFFETSCPHCQAEAPALCSLAGSHPGVRFLGVDAALDSAGSITGFRRDHMSGCDPALFPLRHDPGDTATHAWRVAAVPTVYLIGADGRIAYAGEGEAGVNGLTAALAALRG